MPGLSNPRPIKGAYGIGKVNLKFTPLSEKKKKSYIGFMFFCLMGGLIVFRYMWSKPGLRYTILTPVLRSIYLQGDYWRCTLGAKFGQGERDTFNYRYTPSDVTLTNVPGLKGEWARITRDVTTSMLTVSGKSAVDAIFAQGYAHASERLYQLDISRRKASGTLSEVLGQDYLILDRASRTYNFRGLALQDWQRLSTEAETESKDKDEARKQVALLTAYAAGINAFLAEKPVLPMEFYVYHGSSWFWWGKSPEIAEWCPIDSLALLRMYYMEGSQGWEHEYLKTLVVEQIGPEAAESLLKASSAGKEINQAQLEKEGVTVLPASSGAAWVVPGRGSTKAPLMASDLHSPLTSYNQWIMNELRWSQFGSDSTPVHLVGSSLPGVPLVLQGRNELVSWSYATAAEDTEDLFIEEIVKEVEGGPMLVLAGGEAERVEERREAIAFPGKGGVLETEHLVVQETRHGPVISPLISPVFLGLSSPKNFQALPGGGSLRGVTLALSSQALRQPMNVAFMMHLATASGWVDFERACSALSAASLHVLYADHRGNTGYATTGTPVQRANNKHDASLPVRGDGRSDWQETKKSKSKLRNSKLFTNGAAVAAVSSDLLQEGSELRDLLSGKETEVDVQAVLATMDGVYSPSGRGLAAVIQAHSVPTADTLPPPAMGGEESGPGLTLVEWRSLQAQLEEEGSKTHFAHAVLGNTSFDGQYSADAVAPVFVEAFRAVLTDRVLRPVLPLTGYLRGASLTLGFNRDTRSVALLPNNDWLLRILGDTGPGGWLARQGTSAEEVVGEAIVGAVDWAHRAIGRDKGKGNAADVNSREWKWGHHHSTLHQHFIQRHTIQTAVMTPPMAPEGGSLDTPFRAPYTIPRTEFRTVAYGDAMTGKKGMKGVVRMPFQGVGASSFRSCLRLVADLASPRGLAWSMGVGNVFGDQADPQGLFTVRGLAQGLVMQSIMAESLASGLRLWHWMQYRVLGLTTFFDSGGASGSDSATTRIDLQPTSAGPAPWTFLHTTDASRAAVVRLVKGAAGEKRLGDEL